MTYTPFYDTWEDLPSRETPITADALQHIEDGLVDASTDAGSRLTRTTVSVRDYGCVSDGTTVNSLADARSAAGVGGTIHFAGIAGDTYVIDTTPIEPGAEINVTMDPGVVVKLQDEATIVENVLAAFYVTTDNVSVRGIIDANRDGQDQTAYNDAGGATATSAYGVLAVGTAVTPLSGLDVQVEVRNSILGGVGASYVNASTFAVTAKNSGGAMILSNCDDIVIPHVTGRSIDNDGWKIYPHFFDLIACTRIRGGFVHNTDHYGTGNVADGTALSDYVSGFTMIDCDDVSIASLTTETRVDGVLSYAVGVSLLGSSNFRIGTMASLGYNEVGLEIGGLIDSSFGTLLIDGRYQEGIDLASGRGITSYNNGFYGDFSARSQRFTERVKFGNVTIRRNRGRGFDLFAARDLTFANIESTANAIGLNTRYFPADPSYTAAVRDLTGIRFLNYDFSYNELHGVQCTDLKDSAFVSGRASNNGQANSISGGALRDGSTNSDASGFITTTSVIGAPLTKSGLTWIAPEARDDQTWTDHASVVSTNAGVLSVENTARYHLGQVVKLTGAGAAAADLNTRIVDITHDEVTVDPAPSTFPTTAGTGTISSSGTALTGASTLFTTETPGRYWITAGGQTRQIIKVASNTAATTATAFSPPLSGASFTITKITTAGIPSQKWGMKLSADTIAPRIVNGDLSGNISGPVSDATAAGSSKSRFVSVEGVAGSFATLGEGALVPAVNDYLATPFASYTAASVSNNERLYFTKIVVPVTMTFDQIGVEVVTVGGTTASIVLNVYRHDPATNRPLTKVGTDVTINTATGQATGERTGAFAVTLTPGVYWLASVTQGADGLTPTYRVGNTAPGNGTMPFTAIAGTNPNRAYFQGGVTGTLPSSASGVGATPNPPPIVGLRRSA